MNVLDLALEDGLNLKKCSGGREYQGPCPSCGGTDRFCIYPEQNDKGDGNGPRGSYHCGHGKGGNGCGKAGDSIQYLRDFRSMSFAAACAYLGIETKNKSSASAYRPVRLPRKMKTASFSPAAANSWPEITLEPAVWQEHAEKFINKCHEVLLNREKSLTWLADRGIPLAAVKKYRLGLHLGKTRNDKKWQPDFRPLNSWGMKGFVNPKTKKQKVFALPAGIVIPWFGSSGLLRVKIRLAAPGPDGPKYSMLKGSALDTWLTNPGARAFVVVETELDAILVDDQAGDLVGTVGLGSVSMRPDRPSTKNLLGAVRVLDAIDFDTAGHKGRHWWRENFPNSRRWPVPLGNDPGEAYQRGVDIRSWIYAGLPPALQGVGDPERGEQRDQRLEPQNLSADQVEVKEFMTLAKSSGALLIVSGNGQDYSLEIDQKWRADHQSAAGRLSELVFASPAVGDYLTPLGDGAYKAFAVERVLNK